MLDTIFFDFFLTVGCGGLVCHHFDRFRYLQNKYEYKHMFFVRMLVSLQSTMISFLFIKCSGGVPT